MAIISCPNCEGKLRLPDDSPERRVKCPKCGLAFMARPKGPAADGGTRSVERKPAPKRQESPQEAFNFDELDDQPRSRRRDAEDEDKDRGRQRRGRDDDDRPRSRRRDDDDRGRRRRDDDGDDDDRPRARRRDRDDDDAYDDGPRSKRRSRDEDYDERDDRARKKELAAQFRLARTGMGLVGIGFWCQVGAMGLFVVLVLLAIITEVAFLAELRPLYGLPAMASWLVSIVGFSFLLAGPKKRNLFGLNIALVAVSAIQLLLMIYLAFDKVSMRGIGDFAMRGARMGVGWELFTTPMFFLNVILVVGVFDTWLFLASLFEMARFILFMLVVREIGLVCKYKQVAKKAMAALITLPVVFGVGFIVLKILYVVLKEGVTGRAEAKSAIIIAGALLLIIFGIYIAVYCMTAFLCNAAKDAIAYRKK